MEIRLVQHPQVIRMAHNGGAIKLDQGSDITITNSLFYDNRSYKGAAIANYNTGEVDIINSTFTDNIWQ